MQVSDRKNFSKNDKRTEYLRYNKRAQSLLEEGRANFEYAQVLGSLTVPHIFRAPYVYYEQCIQRYINKDHDVLELGAGTGLHTYVLMQTGARVLASDISSNSLKVLSQRFAFERERVKTQVADMEALPFRDNAFDAVTSAGSLSYGDPELVDAEICRVLRPGGIFICVDSLNHNPIYRLNRWIHCLRGDRTKSTLLHMPTMERIQSISRGSKDTDACYFGAVSYLTPALARIIGQNHAAKVSDVVDRMVRVRRSAFKFVLVARGPQITQITQNEKLYRGRYVELDRISSDKANRSYKVIYCVASLDPQITQINAD